MADREISYAEDDARPKVSFATDIAKRKLSAPEGWQWCKWRAVGDDSIYEGGVPGVKTRGQYKGQPNWRGVPLQSVVVTRAEINEAKKQYEIESGLCAECLGTGEVWAGTNFTTKQVRVTTCRRCKGDGLAASPLR